MCHLSPRLLLVLLLLFLLLVPSLVVLPLLVVLLPMRPPPLFAGWIIEVRALMLTPRSPPPLEFILPLRRWSIRNLELVPPMCSR